MKIEITLDTFLSFFPGVGLHNSFNASSQRTSEAIIELIEMEKGKG